MKRNSSLAVYNHPHTVILSLINAQTSIVSSLHRVNIVPTPEYNIFHTLITRRTQSQLELALTGMHNPPGAKIYIDDPMAISHSLKETELVL